MRVESVEGPGDLYYSQVIKTPVVTKEHMVVNFNEGKPKFTENKPIVKPLAEEANKYNLNHDLRIPVEDQRFAA